MKYSIIHNNRLYIFNSKNDVITWATKKNGTSFYDNCKIQAAKKLRAMTWGK